MTAPVAWLLDTNTISEMMRPKPVPQVAKFLDRIAGEGIGLAAITVWEILNGIGRLDPGRRRDDLVERFQGMCCNFQKSARGRLGWVDQAPSYAATSNSLLMN